MYYNVTKERPPAKLLVKALEYVQNREKALDLGSGSLKDSKYLLELGFDVTAVDKRNGCDDDALLKNEKLHYHIKSFEDFDFENNHFDVINAMYSLPFINQDNFDNVFNNIKMSLKVGGVFCGQFFGKNDSWNINDGKMSFHDEADIRYKLKGFDIKIFEEVQEDGTTMLGKPKHWHVFHVVAKKLG